MKIEKITDKDTKQKIVRKILEALPDWFGIPEAREEYIENSADQICIAAAEDGKPVGFLCLNETGKDTMELTVMGILQEYHRQGIGRALVMAAKETACSMGYSFLQVKTVRMGQYDIYDDTNRFYLDMGFKEFEVFPTLWDEWNPCQIYVMYIR